MELSQLYRYLSGDCSETEKKAVENWIAKHPENKAFFRSLEKIWQVEPKDEFDADLPDGWKAVENRITPPTSEKKIQEQATDSGKKSFPFFVFAAAAAIILLVTSLFVMTYYRAPAPSEPVAMQQLQTQKGQRATFTLSDGSKVHLNADSRLQISTDFNATSREVYLEGEAFFEVVSNKDRPFIVYANGSFTHVLGTKFGVLAYPREHIRTVVEEGSVLFGIGKEYSTAEASKQARLTPNEIAEIDSSGTLTRQSITSLDEYLGWKDGKLVFYKTPLREIKPKLERWYDITLHLESTSLLERRLTATFQNEPLTEVLNVLALSLNLRYQRSDREIILSEKK